MDFNAFNSRSGANKPSRLHVCHPATGDEIWSEPPRGIPGDADYFEGKPCIVLVLGAEGADVQAQLKRLRAQKMTDPTSGNRKERRAKKAEGIAEVDDRSVIEVHAEMAESAVPLIAGFENIERDGKPLTTSHDDVMWFLCLQTVNGRGEQGQKSFLEQVLEHSGDRANYLGNGSTT